MSSLLYFVVLFKFEKKNKVYVWCITLLFETAEHVCSSYLHVYIYILITKLFQASDVFHRFIATALFRMAKGLNWIDWICIAPVNQLSAVKNEFSSEGLRVFDQEHPAGKQKYVPPKTDREGRITNSTYALEGLFLSQPPDWRHDQSNVRIQLKAFPTTRKRAGWVWRLYAWDDTTRWI